MEMALIVFRQTLVMFLYMAAGFGLFKAGKLSIQGSRDLAALLVWLVLPVVIANSFCVEWSMERLAHLLYSSLLGVLALLLSMVVARVLYPKAPIEDFAAAFSNAGFMGIPLIQAALGAEAVFYAAAFIAMLNVLQWTYGVSLMTGQKEAVGPKNVLCNPIMLGTLAGVVLFVTGAGAHLPAVVRSTLQGLGALNAPLAMLVLGCYLAQTQLATLFTQIRLYGVSVARLLVIPLLTLLLFWPLPLANEIKLAIFICASAPVGANVAVYAQLHGLDYPYACQIVSLSTLLSVICLPLMLLCANALML